MGRVLTGTRATEGERPDDSDCVRGKASSLVFDAVPKQLDWMLRLTRRQMLDLLAAGNPRRDNFNFIACRSHSRRESAVADLGRQLVMFLFEAERSGHATAAGVDFADLVAGSFEHRDCRSGTDQ